MKHILALLPFIFFSIAPAKGQEQGFQFQWQVGQTLVSKISHQTSVQEIIVDPKLDTPVTTESRTNLTLTRKWLVKEVDAAGTATLEMQISAMRNELRQADGTTIVRDSADPENAKEMANYLGKTIVIVRIDRRGQLVEIKELEKGSSGRLSAELPFRILLPNAIPMVGQSWERSFAIKLDPPLGLGESHNYIQSYTFKGSKDGLAIFGVQTALKHPPKTASERIPLVPFLWSGDIYFNAAAGRYHAARLTSRTEIPDHLGTGSKFIYQSSFSEDVDAVGR